MGQPSAATQGRAKTHRAPWVRDITRDAIRHFAWGIGDANPLWLDRAHARQSRHGSLLAPPCFAYALHETSVAPGMAERARVYRSVQWTWFDVLREGLCLAVAAHGEHRDRADGDVEQLGHVEFTRGGAPVARARSSVLRPVRPLPTPDAEPRYEAKELAEIEATILMERRRGSAPRYWEDTREGERLGPLLKGPLSIMDVVAWVAGAQGHPEASDDTLSDGGLSSQQPTGPQQVAWACQLVTDWMGDEALLHRLEVSLGETPQLGSTTRWQGTVTHLWREAEVPLVTLALGASDRRGRVFARGTATVILPSREYGPVKLPVKRRFVRPGEE